MGIRIHTALGKQVATALAAATFDSFRIGGFLNTVAPSGGVEWILVGQSAVEE
jgi:hypothetical protein